MMVVWMLWWEASVIWLAEICERSFVEDHYSELAEPDLNQVQKKAQDRSRDLLASCTSHLIKYTNHLFSVESHISQR